jgi:hypothetical protein
MTSIWSLTKTEVLWVLTINIRYRRNAWHLLKQQTTNFSFTLKILSNEEVILGFNERGRNDCICVL